MQFSLKIKQDLFWKNNGFFGIRVRLDARFFFQVGYCKLNKIFDSLI